MRKLSMVLAASLALSGCAANKSSFYADPHKQKVSGLCRVVAKSKDPRFVQDVIAELQSRGVTPQECQQTIARENAIIAGLAIAGAAVAVGVAAHNGAFSGGGGGSYGVAWDRFRNQYYQPVWRCRDKFTGRFVSDYRCSGLPMNDYTWPG